MLTRRQQQVFRFIEAEIARTGGIAPSYTEIMQHLGLSGRGNVHDIVVRLEQRGLIRRLPGRTRAIEIVRTANRPTVVWLKFNDETKTIEPWGRA